MQFFAGKVMKLFHNSKIFTRKMIIWNHPHQSQTKKIVIFAEIKENNVSLQLSICHVGVLTFLKLKQ